MDGGNGSAAVLAPDGTATAVWVGYSSQVFSREARPGQAWGAPQAVPDSGRVEPFLIADGDERGSVTAVWATDKNLRYTMWSAEHPAGGSWSKPVKLGDGSSEDIGLDAWDLAAGPSGAAVLAWNDADGGGFRVTYRERSGGAWSEPKLLSDAHYMPTPTVTVDRDGRATVAYLSGNKQQLTFLEGSAEGWRWPVQLPTPGGRRGFDIETGRSGESVVAWQDPDHRLLTSCLVGGKLSTPQALVKDAEPAASIDVAAAPDGSAQFVWTTAQRGASSELHSVEMSACGGTPGDVQVVGQADYCPASLSTGIVSGNERGDALAAWSARSSGLRLAHRDHGAGIWTPQEEAVPDGQGPNCGDTPTVAIAEDGSVLTTWTDSHSRRNGYGKVLLARRATPTD